MNVQEINELYKTLENQWNDCDWCQLFPYNTWDDNTQRHVEQYDAQCVSEEDVKEARTPVDKRNAKAALLYRVKVQASARAAQDLADDAIQALGEGRYEDALDAAEAAADEEGQWGDCPVWGQLRDAIQEFLDEEREDQ